MTLGFQEGLFRLAIPLSILGVAVFVWAIRDCLQRKRRFKRGWRDLWLVMLTGCFLLGLATPGLVVRENLVAEPGQSLDTPDAVTDTEASLTLVIPLPFYRYRREAIYRDGELVGRNSEQHALIPFPFLLGLLAYLLLAIDWEPIKRRLSP